MGKKFDEGLPNMTDEELAGVDEQKLNETSRQNLLAERQKREVRTAKEHHEEGTRWYKTNASIAGLAIIVAILAIIVTVLLALWLC